MSVDPDPYYILATSAPSDQRARVLKHGDTFAIFDSQGDIQAVGLQQQGLFYEGTRFLSKLVLRIEGYRPLLLSSSIVEDNALLAVDLTNPDIYSERRLLVPRGALHFFRSKFLWQAVCYERLRIANFGTAAVEVDLVLEYDADFVDIFEVRGTRRARRGAPRDPSTDQGASLLSYRGLDGVERTTRVALSPEPDRVTGKEARLRIRLKPKQEETFFVTVSCNLHSVSLPVPYSEAYAETNRVLTRKQLEECQIHSSNPQFNEWLDRSLADLRMMVTDTPMGPYPYAGVPWFSTPFGRDGIITALESLWVNPQLGRGVLRYLASTQASETDPEKDAEPGKILHEQRKGEMAALKEIPFGQYYGSVDATPLFVMLAGDYYEGTGDRGLIEEIWPNVERALQWIDRSGDSDGDGFVEYSRR
ncbi:MAG TPA: glycogen debranching N-terminal domain-containing protein, partial [Myxococcaceae bacterium]|nr:glycogen debranching N-terminal domain-containing protein [Myxococcaceae bacterium]